MSREIEYLSLSLAMCLLWNNGTRHNTTEPPPHTYTRTQTEATYEGVIINSHFPHILYNLEIPVDRECKFMFLYFRVSAQKF
jgi:hypothetical protein